MKTHGHRIQMIEFVCLINECDMEVIGTLSNAMQDLEVAHAGLERNDSIIWLV